MNIKGILRQVVVPYDVFERNATGGVKTQQDGTPIVDLPATIIAQVLSLVTSVTALIAAVKLLIKLF